MGRFSLTNLLSGPIARGSVISMAVSVTGLALVTLQAILTARLLGPEGYGTVAYVLSLAVILATVALFGTQALAVREVAKHQSQGKTGELGGFIRAARGVMIGASVLCVLGWGLGVVLFADGLFPLIFVALILPALAFTLQTQGFLRGFGVVALAQLPQLVLRPFLMVLVLVLVAMTPWTIAPTGYLAAMLFATCAAAVLAGFALRPLTRALPAPIGLPRAEVLRAATPFFVISLVSLVLAEINTLMLAWWAGPEETGLFQPIARITPVLMLAMQSVAVRYGPRVAEFWAAGETDRLRDVTHKVTLATTGFTLLAAVALVMMGEWILGLFGAAFAVNAAALIWVGAAQVINAGCGPVGLLLTMSDKAGAATWPQMLAILVNVALGAVLIPGWGAMGAAVAMAGGIVCWNVAMLIAVRRRMGFDPSLWGALRGGR